MYDPVRGHRVSVPRGEGDDPVVVMLPLYNLHNRTGMGVGGDDDGGDEVVEEVVEVNDIHRHQVGTVQSSAQASVPRN